MSLILSNRVTADAKIWRADPSGRVTEVPAPSLVQHDAYIAACARFFQDDAVDAIYRSSAGQDYIWLLNGVTRVTNGQYFLPSGFQRELVAAADVTGDSWPDLLWYDFETDSTLLWVMNDAWIKNVQRWPHR